MNHLKQLIANLYALKPNDRSELDRHYQISITDAEKLLALMQAWGIEGE